MDSVNMEHNFWALIGGQELFMLQLIKQKVKYHSQHILIKNHLDLLQISAL